MERNRKRPADEQALGGASPPKCPRLNPLLDRMRKVNARFKTFIEGADLEICYEKACHQYLEYMQQLRMFLAESAESFDQAQEAKKQSDEEGRIVLEEKKEQAPTFVPKITGKFAGPPARRTFGPKKVFLGVGVVESTPTPEDSDVEETVADEVQGAEDKTQGDQILLNVPHAAGGISDVDAEKYASLGESSTLAAGSCGVGWMETVPEEPELQPQVVAVGVDEGPDKQYDIETSSRHLQEPEEVDGQEVAVDYGSPGLNSPVGQETSQEDEAAEKSDGEEERQSLDSAPPVGEADTFQHPVNVVDRESLLSNSGGQLEGTEGDKAIADSVTSPAKEPLMRNGGSSRQIFGVKQDEDTIDRPKFRPIVWGSHLQQSQDVEKPSKSSPGKLAGNGSAQVGPFGSKAYGFGGLNSFGAGKGLDTTSGKTLFGGAKLASEGPSNGSSLHNDVSSGKTSLFSEQVQKGDQKDSVELNKSDVLKGNGEHPLHRMMPQTPTPYKPQPFGSPSKNEIPAMEIGNPTICMPLSSSAGWMSSGQKEDVAAPNDDSDVLAHQQPISVFSQPDVMQPYLVGSPGLGNGTSEAPGQVSGRPRLFGGANREAFASRLLSNSQNDGTAARGFMQQTAPTSQQGGSLAAPSVTNNESRCLNLQGGARRYPLWKPFNPVDTTDSANCSPVYAMPPPMAQPADTGTGSKHSASQDLGNQQGTVNVFSNPTVPANADEHPTEKPSVEVTDNEVWEIKFKAKCKLYKNVDNAWRQVGIGPISVRIKKSGEGQGKGWLFCTTDSGSVLMCNPLYPEMQALQQQRPKMVLTSGTFLERKVAGAPGDSKPSTVENWVPSPALIEVATPDKALMLKKTIDAYKE